MRFVERWLMAGALLLAILAGVEWFSGAPHQGPPASGSMSALADLGVAPPESIDVAAHIVAETDPFRLDRHGATVPYRPDLEGVVPPPKPAKPALVLEGLVGTAALLDGVPGHAVTAIVHAGDTLGGLRVRRVGRDTVVVSGGDTTWRLTMRHAWQ